MVAAGELRDLSVFAGCSEAHVAFFAKNSADVRVAQDDWVLCEGESPRFFVLLAGTVDIVKTIFGQLKTIGGHDPGDAFGEVPLLLGSSAVAGIRATSAARLARVDPTVFWRMMHQAQSFAHVVLANMARRVEFVEHIAIDTPAAVCTIAGESRSPACHELRDFLTRVHVAYDWEERAGRECDVCFADGPSLHSPTVRELAARLTSMGLPVFEGGRDNIALERFQRGYQQFPNSPLIRFALGQQYVRTREPDKGFTLFRKTTFPDILQRHALVEARYAYLYSRYEDARRFIRPFFDAYKQRVIDKCADRSARAQTCLRRHPIGTAFKYLSICGGSGPDIHFGPKNRAARAGLDCLFGRPLFLY
ncbi:MAG: cyclic nucleotide-binding domain-containing protein [Candidatus Tumulicola sp.]